MIKTKKEQLNLSGSFFRKNHLGFLKKVAALVVLASAVGLGGCTSLQTDNSLSANDASLSDVFEMRQNAEQAYQQSRWIEAVRLYQGLVERNPSDSGAWFRLGNIYAQQGAFQRAINAYEQSLTSDADQPKAWFNLSTAYLLNAQSAMRGAHDRLQDGDPAKQLISERLGTLDVLVHGRFEEGVSATKYAR